MKAVKAALLAMQKNLFISRRGTPKGKNKICRKKTEKVNKIKIRKSNEAKN